MLAPMIIRPPTTDSEFADHTPFTRERGPIDFRQEEASWNLRCYRSSIGTNFLPTGSPVYWLNGRYNLLSASCSRTCAVQPAVREMAKTVVKRSVGMSSE